MGAGHSAEPLKQLLWLSHEIGRDTHGLGLPTEGSVSARLSETQFGVRASGACLQTLTADQVCHCHFKEILTFIDSQGANHLDLQTAMTRLTPAGEKRPTSDALLHAWLLQLEGVHFVAHCHPEACLQILCSPQADRFADHRLFPDEITHCGPQSTLIPYVEPGAPLTREIRAKVGTYNRRTFGRPPRLILLQNHGIIALGATAEAVLHTTLMAEKAARVFLGASVLGGPIFLTPGKVQNIDDPHRMRR